MTRTGPNDGRATEGIGVRGEEYYTMTRSDLLDDNIDLATYCGKLMAHT